jgi:hypothetical protein
LNGAETAAQSALVLIQQNAGRFDCTGLGEGNNGFGGKRV